MDTLLFWYIGWVFSFWGCPITGVMEGVLTLERMQPVTRWGKRKVQSQCRQPSDLWNACRIISKRTCAVQWDVVLPRPRFKVELCPLLSV